MKLAYMICMLLGIAIGLLVLVDGTPTIKPQASKTSSFIAEPPSTVTGSDKTTATPSNTSTESTTTSITTSSITANPNITTSTPISTPKPTTIPTTIPTTKPTTTTTTLSPPTPTTTIATTSTTVSTSTPVVKTTAQPPSSTISPSNDRHFDGLSFFGGIILATCLMAIAAFSWKFYRQCNERNYRTL